MTDCTTNKVIQAWNSAKPIVDRTGRHYSECEPATLYLKRMAFHVLNPFFVKDMRFLAKGNEEVNSNLAGYLFVGIRSVYGHLVGFQFLPISVNGNSLRGGLLESRFFNDDVDLNCSTRPLDAPIHKTLHLAENFLSGYAASLISGRTTWAALISQQINEIHIPKGLDEVWIWSDGQDESGASETDGLVSKLLAEGVSNVHIMRLKQSEGVHSWGAAFKVHGIYACTDKEARLEQAMKHADYFKVSKFGITKTA